MDDKIYQNLLDSFRRWKVSQRGISDDSLIGYGYQDQYEDSIKLGLYKTSSIQSDMNKHKWYYISNKGINLLQEWENLGLDISFYDSYRPNVPIELKSKLINCISEKLKSVA